MKLKMRKLVFEVKKLILRLIYIIKFPRKRYEWICWRNNYPHSDFTVHFLIGIVDYYKIQLGNYSYGDINLYYYRNAGNLKIGNFVSIGTGTSFVFNGNHHTNRLLTYPIDSTVIHAGKYEDNIIDGDIIIQDDVWIGINALVFSGVTIGKGAIIGANAVVTKDIPPFAVVVGNPSRIIKYRFNNEIINKLLKIDYSQFTKDFLTSHLDLFYKKSNDDNISEILKNIKTNEYK